MAIVPDLSGVRPGRQGNTPLSDPRNRSWKSRLFKDDPYTSAFTVTLTGAPQQVLEADATRNCILFMNNNEEDTLQVSAAVTGAGIPIYATNGYEIRGQAAQLAYYAVGTGADTLYIMVG